MSTLVGLVLTIIAGSRFALPWWALAGLRDDARYEAERPALDAWLAAIKATANDYGQRIAV